MTLRASCYNFFYSLAADGAVLFNSRTGAAMAADETTARAIVALLQSPEREHQAGSNLQRLKEKLEREEFLVPESLNERNDVVRRRRARQHQVEGLNLTIAVTLACNFRCVYCYEDHPVAHMGRATAEALLRFAAERLPPETSLYVTWFGGEPLLNVPIIEFLSQEFRKLCEEKHCAYDCYMITNGYRLTAPMARRLAKLGIRDFQVTLDGEREEHDRQRPLAGGRGTFDVVMRNLQAIAKEVSSIAVRINLMRGNIDSAARLIGRLKAMQAEAPALAISLGHIDNSTPHCGTGVEALLTGVEFADCEATLLDGAGEDRNEKVTLPTPFDTVCSASRLNMYVVAPDGALFKCWNSLGRREDAVGHIEGSVQEDISAWVRFQPEEDAQCRDCKLLPICQGGCADVHIRTGGAERNCTSLRYMLPQRLAAWALDHRPP